MFFSTTLAFSAFWSFAGIWAIERLGASSAELGLTFLGDAIVSAASGFLGGHLSDRLGRKPLMLFSLGGQCLVALAFLAADGHLLFGLSLIVLAGAIAGPGQAAGNAIVADLVPRDGHETAYAATRIAFNLGVVFGPPIAGLLLLADNWSHFFVGVAFLGALTFGIALRHIPVRGAYSPAEPPTRGSFRVIRRDRVFLVFLASTVLAYIVYFGFETALPIAAVDSYGVSPSAWGFLIVMNAGAVAFLQLRLTRRVVRYSPALKLAVALPLMGFSFLILTRVTSLAALVVVLLSSCSARCSGCLSPRRSRPLWPPPTFGARTWERSDRAPRSGSPSARSLPFSFAQPRGTMRCGSSWRRCPSQRPPWVSLRCGRHTGTQLRLLHGGNHRGQAGRTEAPSRLSDLRAADARKAARLSGLCRQLAEA